MPASNNSKCTCGATAPPGALFCPMCAHPLTKTLSRTHASEAIPEKTTLEPQQPQIILSNPNVLKSCYVGAILAALLGNLIYYLFFLWYPAAGFLSVRNYKHHTGLLPTVRECARLGLITGAMSFLISLTLFSLALLLAGEPSMLSEVIREQIQSASATSNAKQQMLNILKNPAAMSGMLLVSLTISLGATTLLSTLGGALGAKILDQK